MSSLTVGVDARSLLCAEPRGEGKSLLRLYQEIISTDAGVRPIFFGDERTGAYHGPLPAETRVVALTSFGMRWNLWENLQLPLSARRFGCDVLHGASSGGPRWPGVPLVLTVHDLIPMLVEDGQSSAERNLFTRRLTNGIAKASAVMAVSQHTQRDLCREFPSAAERVHVVPWGAPDRTMRARAVEHERPYALAFGGTAPRKNTVFTLERFAGAAARWPTLDLVLTGISDAAFRDRIEHRIAELGIGDRVRLPGFVAEEELATLLDGASMVLYFSRYEGFGLPLLEAAARRVPVLASNSSSIPEVIGAGCFPLDATDAIEGAIARIATDHAYRARLLVAQAAAAGRYDWRRTAEQALALLRAAAGHS